MSHCLHTTFLITLLLQLASGWGSGWLLLELPPAAAAPHDDERAPVTNAQAIPWPSKPCPLRPTASRSSISKVNPFPVPAHCPSSPMAPT